MHSKPFLALIIVFFLISINLQSQTNRTTFSRSTTIDLTITSKAGSRMKVEAAPDTISDNFLYRFESIHYSSLGIDYDPERGLFCTAHECQSSRHTPTIFFYDSSRVVVDSIALSLKNTGWPWQLDNRTGIEILPNGNLLSPDYNGDLSYADDNIIEISPTGKILNAWEMDDEVGSNDCWHGERKFAVNGDTLETNEIDNIIDIAFLGMSGDTIHALVTAAYDDNLVYKIKLVRTGTLWTPNTWGLVDLCRVPHWNDQEDNLAIDIMGENILHSSWDTSDVIITDLNMAFLDQLPASDTLDGDYHSGVCFMEETTPQQIATTDFTADYCQVFSAGDLFNTPPEISDIADQSSYVNAIIGPLDFTVSDYESDASMLWVSAISDNQALLADSNIVIGGSEENRTITVMPTADATGTALITVTVEDENDGTASDQFHVTFDPVGSLLYVNSATGADHSSKDGSATEPFATITYAVSRATDGDSLDLTGTFIAEGSPDTGVEITKNLILRGQGYDQTFVKGHNVLAENADRRCFTVTSNATVTIKKLTLCNGKTQFGGAIRNHGTLNLQSCVVTDNKTPDNGFPGGGIYNSGTLALDNCTLKSNSASLGGGLFNSGELQVRKTTLNGNTADYGGGIALQTMNSDATINLENSTISGNTAIHCGGGIYLESGDSYTLTADISNATIAQNSCGEAGNGIYETGIGALSELNSSYVNTIIDNNVTNNFAQNFSGAYTLFRSHTICRDNTMNIIGAGNMNNTDPLLNALADNGGTTETHSLQGNSPAIDAGTSKGVGGTDQAGNLRPQGFGYDIGALEKTPQIFFVNSITGSDDGGRDGSAGLPWATISYALSREDVGHSDVINVTGVILEDGDPISGITIDKSVTLVGFPSALIQAHIVNAAASNRRCFTIDSGRIVIMSNLTIEHGNSVTGYGGGILNEGNLILNFCTVQDNQADFGGGISSSGVLHLFHSTISGNTAFEWGGGIYAEQCDLLSDSGSVGPLGEFHLQILNSTIGDNLATEKGGGLYLNSISVNSNTLLNCHLTNVTIGLNQAGTAGQSIHAHAEATDALLSAINLFMKNTLLHALVGLNYESNTSGGAATIEIDRQYSLCGDASLPLSGIGNLNNTDPLLLPLANNGGLTSTMATQNGSPAINAGTNRGILHQTDQRGFPHVNTPDIGAYEHSSFTPLLVELKVFLEGPYNSTIHEMEKALDVPIRSPYSQDPRTLSTLPAGIVDWVLVELRALPGGPPSVSRSALLRQDGRIVADDGTNQAIEMTALPGNYFIVVRHRNHLDVESAIAHAFNTSISTLYDFTVSTVVPGDKFLGSDAALLEPGVSGMYAGDADANDSVDPADFNTVKSKTGSSGYFHGDCNLNGTVNSADYLIIQPNLGKTTQVQ
ncbi:MAG: hypothetical protein JXQ65_13135 [Candidatus Marinimicrobia bacterium]|nr:hypothetical protein [Candidatus Neomarinimicrobiota bacterium]